MKDGGDGEASETKRRAQTLRRQVRGTRIVFGKLEGLLSWAALHFVGHGRVLTLHVEIEQRARTLYRFF